MHKLLARQLARSGITLDQLSPELQNLVQAIDDAYTQSDLDRELMEHSLECTSRELVTRNQLLSEELEAKKTTEAALRRSEERYTLAVEGSNVGIWDWDIQTGEVYFSPAVLKILGRTDYAGFDNTEAWLRYVVGDDQQGLRRAIRSHILGETPHLEFEYQIRRHNGQLRWVVTRGLVLRNDRGKAYRFAGSIEDITERKWAEDQIRFDAIHDSLTGLPNRALLLDRIQHQMRNLKRNPDKCFAILFLDIDRFKLINDSFGHIAGDKLLVAVSHRLHSCIKETDTLARLGGDEFVVLIEDVKGEVEAKGVANRVLESLKHPFFLEGNEIYTSTSIGIVLSQEHHKKAEDLLRDADTAMYRAKSQGKDCFKLFDSHMHEHASTRLYLESGLRRAYENSEFEIFFQPFYELEEEQLIGLEALIRWQHPEKGLLPPGEFMGVAEEIGLIAEMDKWVLKECCKQLKLWKVKFPDVVLRVNVNISARLFDRHDLPAYVGEVVDEYDIDPSLLQLEITESCLIMEGNDRAVTQLFQLKSLGVQLYLDDFGTGYASLSYLHRLPFDGLKIDRSFINKITDSDRDESFVKVIFDLAQSLELKPIAEGIETVEQLNRIRKFSSCHGQGFLFSRPMNCSDTESYISEFHPGMFSQKAS